MRLWIAVALTVGSVAEAFELERARLNPGATDGLVQEAGSLLGPGTVRASLLGHFEHRPLRLVDGGTLVESRWTAHLTAAFGFNEWLEGALQLPVVLAQAGAHAGDLSLGTSWAGVRLAPARQANGAPVDVAAGLAFGLPIGVGPLTRDATVSAFPSLSVGRQVRSWVRVGGSVGLHIRPPERFDAAAPPAGSTLSVGLVVSGAWRALRGEAFARVDAPLVSSPAAAELGLALRYAATDWLEVVVAGGPGFGVQPGTPAFRLLAGLAWVPKFEVPAMAVSLAAADADGDGVPDARDPCPGTAGLVDRGGCPDVDSDQDGVLDREDRCPTVAGPRAHSGCRASDRDADGTPDEADRCAALAGPLVTRGCPDTDGDGLDDGEDRCPEAAGAEALGGCPDSDADRDDVPYRRDNCPDERGARDNHGCPAKNVQRVVLTPRQLVLLDAVGFGNDAALSPAGTALLEQAAYVLQRHAEVKRVLVEVFASDETLAQRRAEAVRTALMSYGVDAKRLVPRGRTDTSPRVELVFSAE